MKRPSEIWWCTHMSKATELGEIIENPDFCSELDGDTELCEIDDKPCDAVRGIILWKKKCSE